MSHNYRNFAPPRAPSEEERALLLKLAEWATTDESWLRKQIDVARVSEACETCPTFSVDRGVSLEEAAPSEIVSEGVVAGTGEPALHFILHVRDGRLSELEAYWEDGVEREWDRDVARVKSPTWWSAT